MAEDNKPVPTLKLFHATIALDVVVLAESEEAAMRIAEGEARKHDGADVETLVEMDHLPPGWDSKCIPFGHRDAAMPDRTLGEWIEAGAAPKYLETKQRNLAALASLRDTLPPGEPSNP